MLALVWANRGDASDMFDAAFGASAEVARNVVDSALAEWNRVVTGYQGQDFETQMTIVMDPTNPATSASASDTQTDANGVPTSGLVTINMAGTPAIGDTPASTVWYLDPTPDDHSEFMARSYTPSPATRRQEGRPMICAICARC